MGVFASYLSIVLIVGGPGSGKGTQCCRMAKEYEMTHLNSGALLRAEVERGSTRGKAIKAMMKRGELVPQVCLFFLP